MSKQSIDLREKVFIYKDADEWCFKVHDDEGSVFWRGCWPKLRGQDDARAVDMIESTARDLWSQRKVVLCCCGASVDAKLAMIDVANRRKNVLLSSCCDWDKQD